jgi:hypothetical protein
LWQVWVAQFFFVILRKIITYAVSIGFVAAAEKPCFDIFAAVVYHFICADTAQSGTDTAFDRVDNRGGGDRSEWAKFDAAR